MQLGLLKERCTPEDSVKESSPYRDIFASLDKPPEPPKSADYVAKKSSFFPSFARKPSFKGLVR